MKICRVILLGVNFLFPAIAAAQSVYENAPFNLQFEQAVSAAVDQGMGVPSAPPAPGTPIFRDPQTGLWRTPDDCDRAVPMQGSNPTTQFDVPTRQYAVMAPSPTAKVRLLPANRYSVFTQEGQVFAFDQELGELYKMMPGEKLAIWRRESEALLQHAQGTGRVGSPTTD
jgi:hypothetical protein